MGLFPQCNHFILCFWSGNPLLVSQWIIFTKPFLHSRCMEKFKRNKRLVLCMQRADSLKRIIKICLLLWGDTKANPAPCYWDSQCALRSCRQSLAIQKCQGSEDCGLELYFTRESWKIGRASGLLETLFLSTKDYDIMVRSRKLSQETWLQQPGTSWNLCVILAKLLHITWPQFLHS